MQGRLKQQGGKKEGDTSDPDVEDEILAMSGVFVLPTVKPHGEASLLVHITTHLGKVHRESELC